MERFALWNLLKTVLSASESPSPTATIPDAENAKSNPETPRYQGIQEGEIDTTQSLSQPPPKERHNACEAYFLRHEQLRSQRKK